MKRKEIEREKEREIERERAKGVAGVVPEAVSTRTERAAPGGRRWTSTSWGNRRPRTAGRASGTNAELGRIPTWPDPRRSNSKSTKPIKQNLLSHHCRPVLFDEQKKRPKKRTLKKKNSKDIEISNRSSDDRVFCSHTSTKHRFLFPTHSIGSNQSVGHDVLMSFVCSLCLQ